MIRFDVKGDKKTREALSNMLERQVPFAASLALNRTITKVRDDELMRAYDRVFNMRNKQFFKLTHTIFNSSAKTFRQSGYVRAAIQRNEMPALAGTKKGRTKTSIEGPLPEGKRRVDTSFMEFHVSGGIRKPLRSKVAVPITKGKTPPFKITRTKTGKVVKAKQAKTLYPQERTFVQGKKSGKSVLMVRTGRRTVKAAYHFQSQVKNRRKYNPVNAVLSGFNNRIKFEWEKAKLFAVKRGKVRF